MKKRQAIIESATRLFGSVGYDATTTLEIAHEADVTEPLIFYHFKGKSDLFTSSLEFAFEEYCSHLDKLPKNSSTEFQKITNLIDLHFKVVDDLPDNHPAQRTSELAIKLLQNPPLSSIFSYLWYRLAKGKRRALWPFR